MCALSVFPEQIYYAGPINNPGFEIPEVRVWFAVLFCSLIIVSSSFLKKEVGREETAEEGARTPENWALISQFCQPSQGWGEHWGPGHGRPGGCTRVPPPTPSYLVGVDNGDKPGEQAAEEGHQHRFHHVVLGQGPVFRRGRGWHACHGAVVLQGKRPRCGKTAGRSLQTPG